MENISFPSNRSALFNLSRTNHPPEAPFIWTHLPIIIVSTLVIGLPLNIFLLFILLTVRDLRTPFNVYLVNLLLGNIFNQIYAQLSEVIVTARGNNFVVLGKSFCDFYLYTNYIGHAIVYNSHFLIALNRVWAVMSPITYRNVHSRRVSIAACVGVWVYVHLVVLPGFVANAISHKTPLAFGCFVEGQPTWFALQQIFLFYIPLTFIIVTYPVTGITVVCRMWQKRHRLGLGAHEGRVSHLSTATNPPSRFSTRLRRHSQRVTDVSTLTEAKDLSHAVAGEIRQPNPNASTAKRASSRQRTAPFLILTLLTAGNVFFMGPLTLYYGLYTFGRLSRPILGLLHDALVPMLYFQPISDVILFTLALNNVRAAVWRCLGGIMPTDRGKNQLPAGMLHDRQLEEPNL